MFTILPAPDSDYPEADRYGALPHPRQNLSLVGHHEAEQAFLDALRAGRLHHAWLICGPEGIGKATLAYRMARYLLNDPSPEAALAARDLSVAPEARAARLIAQGAHPDLAAIRRGLNQSRKDLMTVISVDEVRKGLDVFSKTAAGAGWRIAIIDACDDLNASSANALLKTLEEPPRQGLLLLLASHPGRLLPTIRSRCRKLDLRPLSDDEVFEALRGLTAESDISDEIRRRAAALGQGSVRRALSFLDAKRLAFNDRVEAVLASLPRLDAAEADAVAEATHGRTGEDAFERFCDLCETWLSARLSARTGGDLAPLPELWNKLAEARRDADVYNLDRRPLVIALLSGMADHARRGG